MGFYRQAARMVAMDVDDRATHLTVEHEGKTYLLTVTPARSVGVDLQVDLRE